MTEETLELLAKWDALPEPRELDVAAAMMHATLHIISRAMFSSDSDEIVDVVESGVSQYQSLVRPSLLDLLHLPQWLSRLLSPRPTEDLSTSSTESRSAADRARPRARRRAEGSAGALDRSPRRRDPRRHDGEGSARPGGHHLHGRARDHIAGVVLDLVSALAAPGGGSQAACRARRPCSAAARRHTRISPTCATPAW